MMGLSNSTTRQVNFPRMVFGKNKEYSNERIKNWFNRVVCPVECGFCILHGAADWICDRSVAYENSCSPTRVEVSTCVDIFGIQSLCRNP